MDVSKFISKLKTKYKNLGFSDKAFQGVASYLATTIKEDASDEDIDNAISGVEVLLKSFQGDIDSRVTTAVEKAKKEAAKSTSQETGGTQKQEPEVKTDDMPDWAKAMIEQNKALVQGLSELKTEKTTSTRKQALEAKLKDAPDYLKGKMLKDFARMKFESDEDFNNYLTETETDISEAIQQQSNESLGKQTRPFVGIGSPNSTAAIDADIAKWSEKNKPAEQN